MTRRLNTHDADHREVHVSNQAIKSPSFGLNPSRNLIGVDAASTTSLAQK
jgi:hypothetical protein